MAAQEARSRLSGTFWYSNSSGSCQRPLIDVRCRHEVTSSVLSSALAAIIDGNYENARQQTRAKIAAANLCVKILQPNRLSVAY
jgi:hypothetical protein